MRVHANRGKMLGRIHFVIMTTITVSLHTSVFYVHASECTLFAHVSFAAAHIELLGIVHYDACTAVNARIIQCWEIKDNTCPPVNTSLTVPTCATCPTMHPLNVGDHYLIAGVRHKRNGIRRIILPSTKKTGFFGLWDDKKYADIANWIQRGNSKEI